MKKFIIFSLLCGWVLTSYSQEIIQLEEAEVNFQPTAKIVFEDMKNGKLIVKEAYAKQFESNPIRFLSENFDIAKFIEANEDQGLGDIIVRIESSKGYLKANYDKNGDLEKTYQQFNDIVLPYELIQKLYVDNPGWSMTENKYLARSHGEEIVHEKYVIKMKDGNNSRKLKIDPLPRNTRSGVAYIENDDE